MAMLNEKSKISGYLIAIIMVCSSINYSGAGDIAVVDNIQGWHHPVKAVFQKHKVKLHRVELLENRTYPVFYVTFPYDPHLAHNDNYFKPLYYETLQANGFWNYAFISRDDNVRININWDKRKKLLLEDIQDVNDESKIITLDRATEIVRSFPEVNRVIKAYPSRKVHIELMEDKPERYIFRAYTIVPPEPQLDLPSHTATFGWYSVIKQNGQITAIVP